MIKKKLFTKGQNELFQYPYLSIWFVGIIFLLAAFLKLLEPNGFYAALTYSNLFQPQAVYHLTYIIPGLELFLGLSLIAGIFPRKTISGSILLLIGFSIYLVINHYTGSKTCGCFGMFDLQWPLWANLTRNFGLIVLLAIGFLKYENQKKEKELVYLLVLFVVTIGVTTLLIKY